MNEMYEGDVWEWSVELGMGLCDGVLHDKRWAGEWRNGVALNIFASQDQLDRLRVWLWDSTSIHNTPACVTINIRYEDIEIASRIDDISGKNERSLDTYYTYLPNSFSALLARKSSLLFLSPLSRSSLFSSDRIIDD